MLLDAKEMSNTFSKRKLGLALMSAPRLSGLVANRKMIVFKALALATLGTLFFIVRGFVSNYSSRNVLDTDCIKYHQIHSWELTSGSFWVLLTCMCVCTLILFAPRAVGRRKYITIGIFTALGILYCILAFVYIKSMDICDPANFVAINEAELLEKPTLGKCSRLNESANAIFATSSPCLQYGPYPSFVQDELLDEYKIRGRGEDLLPTIQFMEKLIRGILVPQLYRDQPNFDQDRCTEAFLRSVCRFGTLAECSIACEPVKACDTWCDDLETACPNIASFVEYRYDYLESVKSLFDQPEVFDLAFNLGTTLSVCNSSLIADPGKPCSNLFDPSDVGSSSNETGSGNCSIVRWDVYESEKDRLQGIYDASKASAIFANRTRQNEWLRRNDIVNKISAVLLIVLLLPLCLWLDADKMVVGRDEF